MIPLRRSRLGREPRGRQHRDPVVGKVTPCGAEGNAARGASAYMPHRVGYEVIRKATAEESANQLGRGIQTWMQGGMKVSQ